MLKTANFSKDKKFRYCLTRDWSGLFPVKTVMFIGLNPSTADDKIDDPTIRRCIGFASSWGYNKLIMTNLFAWRETDSKKLYLRWKNLGDITSSENYYEYLDWVIGRENNNYILQGQKEASRIIAAWGSEGKKYSRRVKEVITLLREDKIFCLGNTCRHPLYTRKDIQLMPFEMDK